MSKAIALAAALLVLAACETDPEVIERFNEQMFLGQHFFKNGKFEESLGRYSEAREKATTESQRYQATLGAGTAAAEYSMVLYEAAESLFVAKNAPMARKTLDRADNMASVANQAYTKLLQMRPADTIANYYLGLFFFKRATAIGQLPYPATPEGGAQRRKERDEAMRQFRIVLQDERGDITAREHGPSCASPQAHRYLSLALFTRMNWETADGEHARFHMACYLNYIFWLREKVKKEWPQEDEKQKRDKEKELERLWQELWSTQGLFKDTLRGIVDAAKRWESGTDPEFEALTREEKEKRSNAATREIGALEAILNRYEVEAKKFRDAEKRGEKPVQPDLPDVDRPDIRR